MKDEIISLSHGNGGRKTSYLIENLILPKFNCDELNKLGDGAQLNTTGNLAFSTDSFVIDPYFFPGGDIGKLSVCGTVNDLLMCGSIPKFLSLGLIIEEGFAISDLNTILDSIALTCKEADVKVVTGDFKVVDKGHGHGIFINTSGIGEKILGLSLGKENIKSGDKIIVSGSMGNHGVSILCTREKILESSIKSDCTCLNEVIKVILEHKEAVSILRDPTRGGLATTLNEFVEGTGVSIELIEENIPVDDDVQTACELLGLDPLYSANEGKVVAVVSKDAADSIVRELRAVDKSSKAAVIGEIIDTVQGKVLLKGPLGGRRILDKLSYDILPRIC